jgi:hypothetical protein
VEAGPVITFIGIVRADGCFACGVANCYCGGSPTPTPGYDLSGRRVFTVSSGSGFMLVVEARPGNNGAVPGGNVPPPTPGLGIYPSLQIVANRPLGNGSVQICDKQPMSQGGGGVPGFPTPDFGPDKIDAMVDLACRFELNLPSDPCTLDGNGNPATISNLPSNGRQYCFPVTAKEAFSVGDTVLVARVADAAGNPGPPVAIVVRR